MNNRGGALNFTAGIYADDYYQTIDKMARRTIGFSNQVVSETSKMDQSFKRLAQYAAGYFAFDNLRQLPGQIVKVRGEFQQLEIALTTMLGEKSRADKLMGEIIQTASTTPFGMKDLAGGTKQLLAYGSTAETVMGEIRMLGDVAAGVSIPIGDLIYLYGTLRSQGRAYAVDIRQFAGRGIPIYAELAKVLQVNVSEVNALVEAGRVGFPQVEQAFRNMTAQGSMFGGLMDAQSKSLPGLIERLKDAVDVMMNDIGKANQGLAEGVIQGAAFMVEHYQEVIDVLTVLTATYGTYKAAVAATNAINTSVTASAYAAETKELAALIGTEAQARISKLGLTAGSAEHAAAVRIEVAALMDSNAAHISSMRVSVKAAELKRTESIATMRAAATKVTEAKANLATAQANQAATANYLSAAVRKQAAQEVEKAQNAVIAAQESYAIKRKAALTATSDFHAKKVALENAATAASVTTKKAAAAAEVRLTAAQSLRAAVMRQLVALQTAFNASMLSNPIVLATTAIVALGVAMWALNDSTTAQEKAQASLNKINEEAARRQQELASKTSSLNSVIRDETQTRYAQLKAFTDLQKLYPEVIGQMKLHEFQALSTAEAQRILNRAMEDAGKAGAASDYEKATKKIEELEKKLSGLLQAQSKAGQGAGGFTVPIETARKELAAARIEAEKMADEIKERERLEWLSNAPVEERKSHYQDIIKELEKERSEIENSLTGVKNMQLPAEGLKKIFAEMRLIQLNKDLKEAKGHLADLGAGDPSETKNKTYWEKQKSEAEGRLAGLDTSLRGSAEWNKEVKAIQLAQTQLDKYNTTVKKVSERDKPQPYGSLAYWNQVAQKAQEVIDKTDPTKAQGAETIRKQQEILRNAQAKAEQAKLDLMPFGSIQYWEQVQKIARDIMSQTPATDAAGIEKQKAVIARAQEKADEIRKAQVVRSFDEELEYKRSQYELYERWVRHMGEETAKTQFSGLVSSGSSFVEYLHAQINQISNAGLSTGGLSDEDLKRIEKLKEAMSVATGQKSPVEAFREDLTRAKDEAESLVDYLQYLDAIQRGLDGDKSILGYEKRLATASERLSTEKALKEDLRAFLQEVAGSEERLAAIATQYAQKRAALSKLVEDGKIKDHKRALDAIDAAEKKELDDHAEEVRKKSKEYKALLKIAEKHQDELTKLDVQAAREDFKRLTEGLDKESEAYKEHFEKLLGIEKTFQQKRVEALYAIGDVAIQVGDVMRSIEGGIGNAGKVISVVGSQVIAVAQTIEKINKANKNGKGGDKFNIQDITSIVSLVTQVIGLVANRVKMIGDEFENFLEGIVKLQHDQAIQSNNKRGSNYSDNPFISDYTGMIKAGVDQYQDALRQYSEAIEKLEDGNAIIGYRGGFWRKKKNRFITSDLLETYPDLIDAAGALNRELAETLIATNMIDERTKRLLESAISWSDQMEAANAQFVNAILDMTGVIGNDLTDAMVNAFKAGEDGAKAMSDVLGGVVETFVKNTVLLDIFRPLLDEFRQGVKDSYASGGDGTIIDDIYKLNSQLPDAYNIAEQVMTGLRDQGRKHGMSIFDSESASSGVTATKGYLQGVTEQTVSQLVGQSNAIRIYQAEGVNLTRISVNHLSAIAQNTSFNRYLVRLERMEVLLDDIKGALKSVRI